jgi:hypothetical protein
MDWFERLTGFREGGYEETRARLRVEGGALTSDAGTRACGVGPFETVSLQKLRERAKLVPAPSGRLRVKIVQGDVRRMHQAPEYVGALFQVASQFNMLEMPGPHVTPEHGVTGYQHDHTQGPACALAAGAATIYRNYFVPVDGGVGQTKTRQIDGLAPLGKALAKALHRPVEALWEMRNGYALCTASGLDAIGEHLATLSSAHVDLLRGLLAIGVHSDVEVTDAAVAPGPFVSQAFCSALPVAYGSVPAPRWKAFATLVLEAAYEATLCAAALNARRGASKVVLLTLLGGGAFGNDEAWIFSAMRRALEMARTFDLDVRIVSFAEPSSALQNFVKEFQ